VRAGIADAATVTALGRSTYEAHFARHWSPAGLAAYLDKQFDLGAVANELVGDAIQYFLAYPDPAGAAAGPPVAYAKVAMGHRLPVAAPPLSDVPGIELVKLYCRPEATGCGYGSSLLIRVLDVARADRAPYVWLDVLKTNVRGRRMYERHGFTLAGELPFRSDIEELGFVVLWRVLQGPS
jgi:ribosomal protein S18 acetylase RimI-like enzyme